MIIYLSTIKEKYERLIEVNKSVNWQAGIIKELHGITDWTFAYGSLGGDQVYP